MIKPFIASTIYERAYYRLYGKFNGAAYFNYIKKAQWNSFEKNKEIQAELLYEMLKYASTNIPYYKRIFQEKNIKLKPEYVFDELRKMPILTKDIIRREFKKLYKIKTDRKYWWYYETSGGSTGEPVRLIQDNIFKMKMLLVNRLQDEWAGCKFGERKVKLWGSERDIFQGSEDMMHRVANWLKSLYLLNSFLMDEKKMKSYINIINKKKPKLILAYVQSINELAKFIESNNIEIYSPTAIMTSAGVLYPSFRKTIENVFRCPVLNSYGSREVGDVACECAKREGLHVNTSTHYLEILNKDLHPCQEGEIGELYVTLLSNFTMPLIRYKIGDMAVYTENRCSCGRGLPLIKDIVGRDVDLFINNRNELIDGEYFTHLFYFKDYIKRFQVIQKSKTLINVKLVVNSDNGTELIEKDFKDIRNKISIVMGQDCIVEFKIVDDIRPTKSGKYRYTIKDF